MSTAVSLAGVAQGIGQMSGKNRLLAMLAAALAIALAVSAWLWSSTPDYKVLFSNVSDRDGGAIVAALAQQNVPYKVSEGGSAILVPATMVHDVRLKLASQGLPRGGVVGFELMDNQKLGATQFQEQVNYQRAVEGELARSIQTLSALAAARVHLAIPKPSVFLREQQKPSASVIVTLNAGRTLDRAQVAGIAHLVSSSVPELAPKAVSVLDQHGNLLSGPQENAGGLDANQLTYVQSIETATIKRISDILEPIVGRANLRVQVTAELDFSQQESTAETYRPNQGADNAVIRNEQRTESSENASSTPAGVPGSASNQPGAAPTPATGSGSTRKEATISYEVDKTVRHVRAPVGTTKRLSAAVVINHRKGKALEAAELTQLTALAKEAMGFSEKRGDTINVANAPFSVETAEPPPEVPLWKQPEILAMSKEAGKILLAALAVLYLVFGVIRPLLRSVATPQLATEPQLEALPEPGDEPVESDHQQRLVAAKQLAKSDPKVVANVVKNWVAADE